MIKEQMSDERKSFYTKARSTGEFVKNAVFQRLGLKKSVEGARTAEANSPHNFYEVYKEMGVDVQERSERLLGRMQNVGDAMLQDLALLTEMQQEAIRNGVYGPNVPDYIAEKYAPTTYLMAEVETILDPIKAQLVGIVGPLESAANEVQVVFERVPVEEKAKGKPSRRIRFSLPRLRGEHPVIATRLLLVLVSFLGLFKGLTTLAYNDDDGGRPAPAQNESDNQESAQVIIDRVRAYAEDLGTMLAEADALIRLSEEEAGQQVEGEATYQDFSISIGNAHDLEFYQTRIGGAHTASTSNVISRYYFSPKFNEEGTEWLTETGEDGQEYLVVYFTNGDRITNENATELGQWSNVFVAMDETLFNCLRANNIVIPGENAAPRETTAAEATTVDGIELNAQIIATLPSVYPNPNAGQPIWRSTLGGYTLVSPVRDENGALIVDTRTSAGEDVIKLEFTGANEEPLEAWMLRSDLEAFASTNGFELVEQLGEENSAADTAENEVIMVTYLVTDGFNPNYRVRTEPDTDGEIIGDVPSLGSRNILVVNHSNGRPVAEDGWIEVMVDMDGELVHGWISEDAITARTVFETVERQTDSQEDAVTNELLVVNPEEINVHEFTVSRTALEAIFGEGNVNDVMANDQAIISVFSDRLITVLNDSALASENHGDAVFAAALANAVAEAERLGLPIITNEDDLADAEATTNIIFIATANHDEADTFTVTFMLKTLETVDVALDTSDTRQDGWRATEAFLLRPDAATGSPVIESVAIEAGENHWYGILDTQTITTLSGLFSDVEESQWTESNAFITTVVVREAGTNRTTEYPSEILFADGTRVTFDLEVVGGHISGRILSATLTPTPTEEPTESATTDMGELGGFFTISNDRGHIEFFNVSTGQENGNGGQEASNLLNSIEVGQVYTSEEFLNMMTPEEAEIFSREIAEVNNGGRWAVITGTYDSFTGLEYPILDVNSEDVSLPFNFGGLRVFDLSNPTEMSPMSSSDVASYLSEQGYSAGDGRGVVLVVALSENTTLEGVPMYSPTDSNVDPDEALEAVEEGNTEGIVTGNSMITVVDNPSLIPIAIAPMPAPQN